MENKNKNNENVLKDLLTGMASVIVDSSWTEVGRAFLGPCGGQEETPKINNIKEQIHGSVPTEKLS